MRAELAALAAGPGPFLSIYLDVSPGPARAAALDRLGALAGGLDDVTEAQRVALADGRLLAAEPLDHDATLAALIDADGRHFAAGYPQSPRWTGVVQANLPYLAPILHAEQALTHHVLAVYQPGQLDVITVPRHGDPAPAHYAIADDDVPGPAPYIQRICHLSQTTLLVLAAPAAELDRVTDQIQIGLPLETTVVGLALDDLDDDQLSAEVARATATHAANRTVELLRLWRFHHSQGEAVTGLADTVQALANQRAALLLIHDDPTDERHAWYGGSDPSRIAIDMSQAAPIAPGEQLLEGRLTDVLLRAALLTGCPAHVVPTVEETLDDGVGVILADRTSVESLTELLEL